MPQLCTATGQFSDRSSGAGDLICAIELLRLVVVVGDAGRAARRAIFISITPACRMSAGSFSAYLVSSGLVWRRTPLLGAIHQAQRPSSTL